MNGFPTSQPVVTNVGPAPEPWPQGTLAAAVEAHRGFRFEDAKALYQSILDRQPDHAEALHNLGVLLSIQLNNPLEALPRFEKALKIAPEQPQYWLNYADALVRCGRIDEFRALLPDMQARGVPLAHLNALKERLPAAPAEAARQAPAPGAHEAPVAEKKAVVALYAAGDLVQAESRIRALVQAYPQDGYVWKSLGVILQALGHTQEAFQAKQKAAQLLPLDAEALSNYGRGLRELGRYPEALEMFERAAELNPRDPTPQNNLGIALFELDQRERAYVAFKKAMEINPNLGGLHSNLSGYHNERGEIDQALAMLQKALQIDPKSKVALDNYLFNINYHPTLSAEQIYAVYEAYDEQYGQPLKAQWVAHANERRAGRRLRVGYVSPDFRNHSCTYFMEPLLAHHDHEAVEVFAYADLAMAEDPITQRYKTYVDHWVPTRGMSDEALARRIRADRIDILVDLAGHTSGNRLEVFARKPAPVSVTWMGYGYTTGLKAIDYFLTDDFNAPAGSEALFSEQPWRLPDSPYTSYRPPQTAGEVSELPALQRGHVTFGTLTRGVRINDGLIAVWSELLRRVPGAVLRIDSASYQDEGIRGDMLRRFEAQGIEPQRLQVGYHTPGWDVLREIDIGLDCFPHNSGTTLFETLYMGVPYVSLAGRPSVGRMGGAILKGLGREEWIAYSEQEYLDKLVALAQDLPALARLRAGLRAEMQGSALMDEPGFTRKVEAAYVDMFKSWAEKNT